MRGDFTRDTFDPRKHYSRVLLQQGRVQLDADWNEQSAMILQYLRALARDLIGAHGAPAGSTGFRIINNPAEIVGADGRPLSDPQRLKVLTDALTNGNIVIGAGRYYVDGILIENEEPILYTEQPAYGAASLDDIKVGAYLIYVDVWERLIT
jgi:hypothetical protein